MDEETYQLTDQAIAAAEEARYAAGRAQDARDQALQAAQEVADAVQRAQAARQTAESSRERAGQKRSVVATWEDVADSESTTAESLEQDIGTAVEGYPGGDTYCETWYAALDARDEITPMVGQVETCLQKTEQAAAAGNDAAIDAEEAGDQALQARDDGADAAADATGQQQDAADWADAAELAETEAGTAAGQAQQLADQAATEEAQAAADEASTQYSQAGEYAQAARTAATDAQSRLANLPSDTAGIAAQAEAEAEAALESSNEIDISNEFTAEMYQETMEHVEQLTTDIRDLDEGCMNEGMAEDVEDASTENVLDCGDLGYLIDCPDHNGVPDLSLLESDQGGGSS